MPITFIFAGLFFLGIILAVPLILLSIVLFIIKKKKIALIIFMIPVGLLVFSVGMTLLVFGRIWVNDFKMNMQPTHIFNATFGFEPGEQTEVLEAYIKNGLDYETTLIKFRTTKDTIDKIIRERFNTIPLETFEKKYSSNRHNLPGRVRAWFTPSSEKPNLFYLAEPFNNSFSNVNEAILCYNDETGIAYFHWIGLD